MIEFICCICCSDELSFCKPCWPWFIIIGFLEVIFGIHILIFWDKTTTFICFSIFLFVTGILSLLWGAVKYRKYDPMKELEENSNNNQANTA